MAAVLPARTRRDLVGAGALYVLGAAGFEALAWVWVVVIADDPAAALTPVVGMLQLAEETLELLAITVVIVTLLDYASGPTGQMRGPVAMTAATTASTASTTAGSPPESAS